MNKKNIISYSCLGIILALLFTLPIKKVTLIEAWAFLVVFCVFGIAPLCFILQVIKDRGEKTKEENIKEAKEGNLAKYSDLVCTIYNPKACQFYATKKCKNCSDNVQNMREEDFA